MPALVDRGVVGPGETPVVATDRGSVAPSSGTFVVDAGHVATLPPRPPDVNDGPPCADQPPEVHVHIDRVTVTRAPAPPPPVPPPAPAAPRRTVDHEAYLARRRERR